MRTIQFRAKSLDTQEWVYGSLLNPDTKHPDHVRIITAEGISYPVNPDTVGQRTHFKDMDGTDVYEGDILDSPGLYAYTGRCSQFAAEVIWVDGHFGSRRGTNNEIRDYFYNPGACDKVVSNATDNPEWAKEAAYSLKEYEAETIMQEAKAEMQKAKKELLNIDTPQ